MTTLTYPYLGDAVQVGQPLGCDATGWPYRVDGVTHLYENGAHKAPTKTLVFLEPWPLPSPHATNEEKDALRAAQAHARERFAGVIR